MLTLTLKVQGIDDAVRRLEAMPRKLQRRVVGKSIRAASKPVQRTAARMAPRLTGLLSKSMMVRIRTRKWKSIAIIGPRNRTVNGKNPQAYAHVVEGGSEPHVIKPTKTKALKFTTKAGDTVFAKMVRHPGIRPRHFMRRTAQLSFATAVAEFSRKFGNEVALEAYKAAGS